MHYYHTKDLRKGRRSVVGQTYIVNKKVEGNLPLLVPDPMHPLEIPERADLLIESVKWLHQNERIDCEACTVMPDHFHLVFTLLRGWTLEKVMHSLSSFTALGINRLCGRSGQFWQPTYHDRAIRDGEELSRQLDYVRMNPVQAGYVSRPEEWPFTRLYPDW